MVLQQFSDCLTFLINKLYSLLGIQQRADQYQTVESESPILGGTSPNDDKYLVQTTSVSSKAQILPSNDDKLSYKNNSASSYPTECAFKAYESDQPKYNLVTSSDKTSTSNEVERTDSSILLSEVVKPDIDIQMEPSFKPDQTSNENKLSRSPPNDAFETRKIISEPLLCEITYPDRNDYNVQPYLDEPTPKEYSSSNVELPTEDAKTEEIRESETLGFEPPPSTDPTMFYSAISIHHNESVLQSPLSDTDIFVSPISGSISDVNVNNYEHPKIEVPQEDVSQVLEQPKEKDDSIAILTEEKHEISEDRADIEVEQKEEMKIEIVPSEPETSRIEEETKLDEENNDKKEDDKIDVELVKEPIIVKEEEKIETVAPEIQVEISQDLTPRVSELDLSSSQELVTDSALSKSTTETPIETQKDNKVFDESQKEGFKKRSSVYLPKKTFAGSQFEPSEDKTKQDESKETKETPVKVASVSRSKSEKISSLIGKMGPINIGGFGGPLPKGGIKALKKSNESLKSPSDEETLKLAPSDQEVTLKRLPSLTLGRARKPKTSRPPSSYSLHSHPTSSPFEIGNIANTDPVEESKPDSTVPDSTVPDSTVPDSTIPDSTIPDSTVPDSTIPDSTIQEESLS